jgi:hypothetical protein
MEIIEFEATRCLDGYRIRPARKQAQPRPDIRGIRWVEMPQWTVPGAPEAYIEACSARFERYDAIRISGLFRIFADAPETAEGMRDFAAKFGIPADSSDDRGSGSNVIAALVGPLLAHRAALRAALDRLDAGDATALVDRFARYWGRVRIALRPKPEGGVEPVLVPFNLVQAMWLQLGLHAASEAKLLRCERCGMPFRAGAGTGRRDTAKYCSNACKVAAFRKRHDGRTIHA